MKKEEYMILKRKGRKGYQLRNTAYAVDNSRVDSKIDSIDSKVDSNQKKSFFQKQTADPVIIKTSKRKKLFTTSQ